MTIIEKKVINNNSFKLLFTIEINKGQEEFFLFLFFNEN
jgi:hypothetical protein